MGERKGTNKYYPPDYDPKKGGLNKFMGTHALRERARKLHLGIMIIRFEMPYNIWCEGCNNHIGMGVRYNAEKSKVGMYYSTPVYQFRMKCHLCDNHFEIKTDPANLDYEIISGARRQERRWDPTENGQVVPDDKQVIHKLADDAMFKLQHGVEDQRKLTDVTPTLFKLENLQERWKDDYMANRALRDQFRARKREIQDQQNKDNEFLKKRSLDIQLLPELEDDAKVASLIRLQPAKSSEERQLEKRAAIDKRSKFPYLLAPPSTSTSTDDKMEIVEVDAAAPAVPVKSGIFMASCVESRRKSFGIKLKTDKTLSTSLTNSTINRDEPASSTQTATVASDTDDIKSRCTNVQLDKLEMPSGSQQKEESTANKTSGSTSESEPNAILSSKCTGEPISPSSEKVTSVEPSSSNSCPRKAEIGRSLSALVSYSDDSNNSSIGSPQSD